MIKRGLLILIVCIFSLSCSSFVYAEQNLTTEQQASICINDSKVIMNELGNSSFNITRVYDTIEQTQAIYLAQSVKKSGADYTLVLNFCRDIIKIKENAYQARDEYNALERFYNESGASKVYSSEVENAMAEIRQEISNERYERVPELIDVAYEKIINLEAENTTFNLVKNYTVGAVRLFFIKYWKILIGLVIVLCIFFVLYRTTIMRRIIARKIANLEMRKQTLKKLVGKTQKNYFEEGGMSEDNFNIKTKKFAELIRDIDRQIPLLKEQLAKLEKGRYIKK